MTALSENEHAVIRRCVERQPKLIMRGQHEGYYVHSDVSDLIGVIARLTTALSEASAREGVLEGALEPFAQAAIWSECQTGTNETSSSLALAKAARGETAWADYARARTALSRTTPIEEA